MNNIKKLLREFTILVTESPIASGYEQTILDNIKSSGASGNIEMAAGSDATLPDADITINGKIYNVEVKLNGNAQMGGGSVGWSRTEGFFPAGKEHAREDVAPIADLLNADKNESARFGAAALKLIKALNLKLQPSHSGQRVGSPVNGFPMSGFLVDAWDECVEKGLLEPLNKKIESDVSFIFSHYAKKNVFYIQIGGKGLFYMSKNPANLPVPQLSGKTMLELRPSRSGSGGKPTTGANIRVQARVKIDNNSPFTLDDPDSVKELLKTIKSKKR